MTAITAPEISISPKAAHDAVGRRTRRPHRGVFSEVRESQRQRTLLIAATTTGIASVTAVASAAVILTLAG